MVRITLLICKYFRIATIYSSFHNSLAPDNLLPPPPAPTPQLPPRWSYTQCVIAWQSSCWMIGHTRTASWVKAALCTVHFAPHRHGKKRDLISIDRKVASWTLQGSQLHGHCKKDNFMDIARKSTSWTVRRRQLHGQYEEVNFMESVKKTTSWTLRGSQLYGKCEEDSFMDIARKSTLWKVWRRQLHGHCEENNFMDMMRKMTSQMQWEKCPCRHGKRHDLWEGVGRKK